MEPHPFHNDAAGNNGEHEHLFKWISNENFQLLPVGTHLDGIANTLAQDWPDCCPWHQSLVKNIDDYIEKFPHCCELHAKLDPAPSWFKREVWIGTLRQRLLDTYRQTENLWNAKIDEPDYYEHISEFVEYAFYSFGQLPRGYGSTIGASLYISFLKDIVARLKENDPEKARRISEFIEGFYLQKETVPETDVKLLFEKYSNWLEMFPWQIAYLSPLKQYFASQIPILDGSPKVNRYSGLAKAPMITVKKMMNYIIQTTNTILTTVNAQVLLEKNKLTDLEKREIEVIGARRRHELRQLGQNAKDERAKVSRTLKQWFSGEQRYLRDMKPHWEKMERSRAGKAVAQEPVVVDIHAIENKFCPKMPLSEALKHFGKLTTYTAKNGKPYFNQEQFHLFIARAFGQKTGIPTQRINFGQGDKRLIISLFAEFAANASRQYEASGHTKLKYVKLLCDHIEGFDEKKVMINFKIISGAWD
ncbi:hypothetical protein [Pseudoflavitalea rhizosphaerae]|uniref:hypothetical protein n=1 Tax=Pseudoflavitalea rhizosphaerae TaxID=1884793 RepID=UPI000F8CD32C|nr:hypothetical protein [Pseudoflavitalea rhizosphaerae]